MYGMYVLNHKGIQEIEIQNTYRNWWRNKTFIWCAKIVFQLSLSFQRSADELSAILDEAILAHSFGAMDVKTCGDKVLCEIFIPKESLEDALPQRSSHTLRNLVREKFR